MRQNGFTLAELLIALLILGVIATFTIPKVLQSQQNRRWSSEAREMAGTLSQIRQILIANGQWSQNTKAMDFTPYLNYTKVNVGNGTLGLDWNSTASDTCHANLGRMCFGLHSQARLGMGNTCQFAGTLPTDAIGFVFDPDGLPTTPQNSLGLFIYYDGKVKTYSSLIAGSRLGVGNCGGIGTAADPSWFSWN